MILGLLKPLQNKWLKQFLRTLTILVYLLFCFFFYEVFFFVIRGTLKSICSVLLKYIKRI